MFDQFKNLSSIAGLMKNAGEIKEKFAALQAELKERRVEAETGGGAVRAVVSGNLRVVSIHVDPSMFAALADPERADDRQFAEDLIAGAVNAAMEKAQQMVAEEMARQATEMGLPIPPGTDLSNLLGSP